MISESTSGESSMDFSDLLENEIRWPTAGDRLFQFSSEWMGDAMLQADRHGRFVLMMKGYKEAADLLVDRATNDRASRDTLVYPIIFSYRQFLELSLKYLIQTYGPGAGVKTSWKTDHKLTPLFSRVTEIFSANEVTLDAAHGVVGACVAEFDEVDERSFNFRFALDNRGETIPLAFERVDLVRLRNVMGGLESYFDGADGYLAHREEIASEALLNRHDVP